MIEILLSVILGCLITITLNIGRHSKGEPGPQGPPGPEGMMGKGCESCRNYNPRPEIFKNEGD